MTVKANVAAGLLDDMTRRLNDAADDVEWEALALSGAILGRGPRQAIPILMDGRIGYFRSALGEFDTALAEVEEGDTVEVPALEVVMR